MQITHKKRVIFQINWLIFINKMSSLVEIQIFPIRSQIILDLINLFYDFFVVVEMTI